MENTWLWVDVSSLYWWIATDWWAKYDVFSANEEENKYAKDKWIENLRTYFNNRSSLRKAIKSWEKSSWNKDNDRRTTNISVLADWIINVMVERWKDEQYMLDTYWKGDWNMKLINKVKWLEWWKYASDIDNFIAWDWSDLTWTLSKIFPETVAKITWKEYAKESEEDKWRFTKVWENFLWFMPKVAESANDVWNLIQTKLWNTDERSVQFWNYIYEKYWRSVNKVPEEQLMKDYQEFMAKSDTEKKEYTPTWSWAATKWIEWVADTIITATPWWAFVKWLLSVTWATPWLNVINQWLWTVVGWLWNLINKIPWLSGVRDNLQTEKEKQEWDAFIWWIWLWKWIKATRAIKNLKWWDFKQAFETAKKSWITAAVDELNAKAWWKSIQQLTEKKSELAQRITQPEETKAVSTEKWLDTLSKSKNISKISSIDELSKSIEDEIKSQKTSQMDVAKTKDVSIPSEKLIDTTPSKVVWWERARATTPVTSMLDLLIDYYKDIDVRMVDKYKSYKTSIENWNIKLSDLLELKRDANSWGEWLYDKMWNAIDTKLAWKFDTLRNWFNKVIDWLEWWKELRESDATLSNLYNLRDAVKTIKEWAFKEKWRMSKQSTLWKVLWRMANWLMFWAWDIIKRIYASFMQEAFKIEPKSMSNLEISKTIPNLLKEYKSTISELERAKSVKEATNIFNKFAKSRWLDSRENFKASTSEQAWKTPKSMIYAQYYDDARKNIKDYFWETTTEEVMY